MFAACRYGQSSEGFEPGLEPRFDSGFRFENSGVLSRDVMKSSILLDCFKHAPLECPHHCEQTGDGETHISALVSYFNSKNQ